MSIDTTLSALHVLGGAWRGDWTDFDGRVLRNQLDEIARMARREAEGKDVKREYAGFLAGNDICGTCASWTEHCICGARA